MKHIVVGTAGHIDHGKSALVKALTGTDPDRLEEEKHRGITIDLGFAHLDLPAAAPVAVGRAGKDAHAPATLEPRPATRDSRPVARHSEALRIGFVDVPGHERFVKNMLAGIGGIDLVLLVVAADESIKPQTREHFDICCLLGVRRGLVALTKSDLVDREILDLVRLEIEDFVAGSFLAGAPIVPVSSRTGEGTERLKDELWRLGAEVPARAASRFFRLPIDRAFVMKGFGAVVTGTLVAGTVEKEAEVEIFPERRRARTRGIQVHNEPAERATAGQRTALNLAGVEAGELERGMVLAPPGLFEPTQRIDTVLHLLPSARALKNRSRVHFHSGTASIVAEVRLSGAADSAGQSNAGASVVRGGADHGPQTTDHGPTRQAGAPAPLQLEPGATTYAQLLLREPTLLLPGDRFIVRQFSPVITIGGGRVLDNQARRRRAAEDATPFLKVLESGSREQVLLALLEQAAVPLEASRLMARTGWSEEELREAAGALAGQKQAEIVSASPLVLAHSGKFRALLDQAVEAVHAFHAANPLLPGISREELRERLFREASPLVFERALALLAAAGKLEAQGEVMKQAGRQIVLSQEEEEARRRIEAAFEAAGLAVPSVKEVLSGLPVEPRRAHKILQILIKEKTLLKISEGLVFHSKAIEQLRAQLAEYKKRSDRLNVAAFKDMAGITRKYAIPLLEYLDRERITRRAGDERIIL
jgi:selenocysteine-specific elongation factor